MKRWRTVAIFCVALTSLLARLAEAQLRSTLARNTPLDQYVAKDDGVYQWKVINTDEESGLTTLIVDMTSQRWRTADEVDRTLWKHWLVIARPEKVVSNIGFVFISGGSNRGGPPSGPSEIVKQLARATNTVVAELRMVPNQPLEFHHDGKQRSEDDLIAYCWDQFLKTGDPTWLPRFPMAKSAVRAMDTITALLASDHGGRHKVNRFVVAGGSKRGWATWITAAVDRRVVAIVPIVIDILNVTKSMNHHFAAYGFFSPAVWDYVRHKITARQNTPEMEALRRNVDPYEYRDRLTMPKYIVNASGDQFFVPDSSQFYFDDLKGEKYLRYVPNGEHSLRGTDARDSIAAFYWAIINHKPRPKFDWSFEPDGAIRVKVQDRPKEVYLWQATNPNARDFRVEVIGRTYTKTVLKPQEDGTYVARVDKPATGFRAYYVELVYDIGAPYPLKLTTAVRIVPDVLPFADKDPSKAGRARHRSRKSRK